MAWFLASHCRKGHETEPSLLQEQLNDCDLATTNPTTPIPQDATQILIVIATSDTLIIPGSNTCAMDKSLLKTKVDVTLDGTTNGTLFIETIIRQYEKGNAQEKSGWVMRLRV
uniref:OSJNBa0064G10.5 protein n=4 Tax=Oryza TaxID=4527 RepID=Q7XKC6_ORYSJ|nr:OSJNBa0064G10.5 [Oryza sativa Japonica Group]CAH68207.1 H0101F08.5 [Oryza sativa]